MTDAELLDTIASLLQCERVAEQDAPEGECHVAAPDGWMPPSNILSVTQGQYVSAAETADSYRGSLERVMDDWRSVMIRPKAIDALFIASHTCLLRVKESLRLSGSVSPDTVSMLDSYLSSVAAQDTALREFLEWSIRSAVLTAQSCPDDDIHRIVSNLAAADLIDLLSPSPVGAPATTT